MTVKNILSPDGVLTYGEGAQEQSFTIERSPLTWSSWLARGSSFVVQTMHPEGYALTAYTARCEQAQERNAHRWYGYKRYNGKLMKRYLGRTEDLTLERLQEAVHRFSSGVVRGPKE